MRKIIWYSTTSKLLSVIYKGVRHTVHEVRCEIKSVTYGSRKYLLGITETKSNNVTFHTIKEGVYKKEICTIC